MRTVILRNFVRMIISILFLNLVIFSVVHAQRGTPTQCGTKLEGELTTNTEIQNYTISLAPGDTLHLKAIPLGDSFSTDYRLFDPTNKQVDYGAFRNFDTQSRNYKVSATGNYIISIKAYNNGPLGAYTLYVGCTLRDGTVINPGDAAPAPNTNGNNNPTPSAPTFSGTGFPGLAPVDFVDAITTDLNLGQATKGKLPAGGNAVLGYTFDAAANDNLALSFNRVSGNLNLGLVVLSAENKVIFQASLVTTSEFNAKFTLPTAGTYTIGIYRIDLLPPEAPEATAFQITATLNP